jgi:cell division protein FtsZ
MVFITAGMGGGTGTGAAPIIAETARAMGALTIAVVTKPFTFEGAQRRRNAESGIAKLTPRVDTIIMIPNDRLLDTCTEKTGIDSAFKMADDVLRSGVQTISEVVTVPGLINLDFADVKAITRNSGPAWMSIGIGSGKNRAIEAAKEALASPLLDVEITGARGVLYNVIGGETLSLYEVNEAAEIIKKAVSPDANIIFGVAKDDKFNNEVKITLIATGFDSGSVSNVQDDAVSHMLKDIKSDDELDMPSFLRRPAYNQKRAAIPNSREVTPQETRQPVKQANKSGRQSIEDLVAEE